MKDEAASKWYGWGESDRKRTWVDVHMWELELKTEYLNLNFHLEHVELISEKVQQLTVRGEGHWIWDGYIVKVSEVCNYKQNNWMQYLYMQTDREMVIILTI